MQKFARRTAAHVLTLSFVVTSATVLAVALDSTTRAANTITYVATFPAGTGTGALTEAGILNAASTGNMLCRTVFGIVTKTSSDTVIITWNVTVA